MQKLAIGVDIGGTRTKVGLVDLSKGAVIAREIIPTETKDARIFIRLLESAIAKSQKEVKNNDSLMGIGIGIPGFVFENGTVDSTYGFLEFMEDYPLKTIIEERLQLSCQLDNDARVVALGEALYGAGKSFNRVLVLTLGTGLGVGFAINGSLNEPLPFGHMAGHMQISEHGRLCYCGKKGCLEDLVSATGLSKSAETIDWKTDEIKTPISAENIFKARTNQSKSATLLIERYKQYLKTGIDNYVNIFAPDIVVLGGGVAQGLKGDLINLHDSKLLNPYKSYQTSVVVSTLREDAGILGSAALFN